MQERIGFVGVGRMGANMARHLKEVGWPVVAVYDVRANAARSLARELHAEACIKLARVTELSDIIFTVVTDDKAMESIFTYRKDNLLIDARGKVFVNCATVSPAMHVRIEKLAKRAGAETLEACMASSITQAREGTLYLMCGGKEEHFPQTEAAPQEPQPIAALRRPDRSGRASKGAGKYGDEYQYRRSRRGPGAW